jgi:hypothetical protein
MTYLPTQIAGQWFYLYLILDLYSRKIRARLSPPPTAAAPDPAAKNSGPGDAPGPPDGGGHPGPAIAPPRTRAAPSRARPARPGPRPRRPPPRPGPPGSVDRRQNPRGLGMPQGELPQPVVVLGA